MKKLCHGKVVDFLDLSLSVAVCAYFYAHGGKIAIELLTDARPFFSGGTVIAVVLVGIGTSLLLRGISALRRLSVDDPKITIRYDAETARKGTTEYAEGHGSNSTFP